MKIGVLTFHKSINNGAVMQCYALTKRLKQELPEATVEVIDYHMPKIEDSYNITLKRYFSGGNCVSRLKKLVKLCLDPMCIKRLQNRKASFESVADYLPLSETKIFSNNTDELFEYINNTYDVVIAGSDAIWNYVTRGFPNPYFLDDSIKCKKFSYAASCYGMNYERIPDGQRQKIKQILDSYCLLGTRDGESEKFAEFVGSSTEVLHTCDPTVTLDVSDLPIDVEALNQKLRNKGFDFSRETIGVMGTDAMCNMLRKMFGKRYQIVALYNPCKKADVNLHELTPYEWAYVFRLFKLTVTTFFHGTLLSLRNGTPVISIALHTDYSKAHTTKVEDFLTRINKQEFYFNTDYLSVNFDEIKAKAESLIESCDRSEIIAAMDNEAKSFDGFISRLKKELGI